MTTTDAKTLAEQVKILLRNNGYTLTDRFHVDMGVFVEATGMPGCAKVTLPFGDVGYRTQIKRDLTALLRGTGYTVAAGGFSLSTCLYVRDGAGGDL